MCCAIFKSVETLPESCEVHFVQLTHTVCTQVNYNDWIYYTSRTGSATVLYADGDPVDILL